jgi:hypothetical protein
VNWGWLITRYNISSLDFDPKYHLDKVNFNKNLLKKYAKEKNDENFEKEIDSQLWSEYFSNVSREKILSKTIYYETANYDAENASRYTLAPDTVSTNED